MAEVILRTTKPEKAVTMIEDAIAAKIAQMELSKQRYRKKLEKFEQKYNLTSEEFINNWTAEDLEGKDLEYIEWAGEYKLFLLVEENLNILKSLEYVT